MKLNMWCDPRNPDHESHCWESHDGGATWRDAGDFTGQPGEPELITPGKSRCPRCKSPLRISLVAPGTSFLDTLGRALGLAQLGPRLQLELVRALHQKAMQGP